MEVLEAYAPWMDGPTTGAIDGDSLLYLANTQLGGGTALRRPETPCRCRSDASRSARGDPSTDACQGVILPGVPLSPGSRVGPYEVVAALGSGGMSDVYRARDPRLQRDVALKVVGDRLARRRLVSSPDSSRRRGLAGSLNHPNIVRPRRRSPRGRAVHRHRAAPGERPCGSGCPGGGVVHLPGARLGHPDRRGPGRGAPARNRPPGPQARERLPHPRGPREDPRLRDREGRSGGGEPRGLLEPTLSRRATRRIPARLLGTPGYMFPSRSAAIPVDTRSDLFAAGTIVYELLAGHRAFQGSSVVESGHAILHDEPEPLPEAVPQPSPGGPALPGQGPRPAFPVRS
jgi:serine/threonine protein kinase